MTVTGRGRWAPRRRGRQQRLIDAVLAGVRDQFQGEEQPVVVLVAFQDFSWLTAFLLLNLAYVGALLAPTYGVRKRRVVILTSQRLLLLSAPVLRPTKGHIQESLPREEISVRHFDPRMMATPELHLLVADRKLRLNAIDRFWAPELVELHRQLDAGHPRAKSMEHSDGYG
ncbi:MAG: hypothetical protein WDA27_13510 [Actinomycetota bacterium]